MSNKINYLNVILCWMGGVAAVLLVAGCATVSSGPVDRQGLSNAIAVDDVRHVRALVEAGRVTVNDVVPGIGYGATPLITVAARNASINVLRYLISAKADLNVRTPDKDTPVMLAALFGREEQEQNAAALQRYDLAVRLLVEAGASTDSAEANSYTPLAYAAYAGRESTVRYLLEKGAKPNGSAQGRMTYVNTPLMMAAMQGHRSAALHLLRAGADAAVRVQNGMTALEFAQKNKQSQIETALRCAESLKSGESFRQRCD